MVVFFSICLVNTPPRVSMPSESGVTSRRRTSFTSPFSTAPWMPAPTATTSSGLTPLCGSLPKSFLTRAWTAGMRVMPPTSTTSSISLVERPASLSAVTQGCSRRSSRSAHSASSLARVSFMLRCFGPLWSAVTKGRLMSVSIAVESSHFAFSAASFRRWSAMRSLRRSIPWSLRNSSAVDSHTLVEVLAAEEGVAVGRLDLEDALADLEDRDVEGAPAQVEDGDLLVLLLVEAVGERGRGGLVDDAEHVQARDLARVLGRLTLAVVEVGGHGDDRLGHLLAQVVLGGLLHLLEDKGGDLGGAVLLAAHLDPGVAVVGAHDLVGQDLHRLLDLGILVPAADQALDREHRVLGVRDRLPAGD